MWPKSTTDHYHSLSGKNVQFYTFLRFPLPNPFLSGGYDLTASQSRSARVEKPRRGHRLVCATLEKSERCVTYSYSSILQAAIGLFEEPHNTTSRYYKEPKLHLEALWEEWRAFASSSTITTDFLTSSFLFGDFHAPISCMRAPKGASSRRIANRNGFETESFPELPSVKESSDSEYRTTAPENPLQPREVEGTPEERAKRERIEMGALKNVADMNFNVFDPVWMYSNGYPGGIPEEITDMMGETCHE
ncbi:hypothetical protein AJ78_07324 [Emergomyces pasteurianus Ep9510]|uniref:Uncharacterized protein n=1 Tax=Emergomyces pasteurianus Ep9510 TaxID=1447872 RepID=A0A1J9QA13_9EURO|nr:hypothetical protein AJ78_07324 [Emergomyces pasteurianus Ep9510]